MTTRYSNKHNAVRAARKELGPEATPGTDFHLCPVLTKGITTGWTWALGPVDPRPPAGDAGAAFDEIELLPPTPESEAVREAALRLDAKAARTPRSRVEKLGRIAVAVSAPRKPKAAAALPAPPVGKSRFNPAEGADEAEAAAKAAKPARKAREARPVSESRPPATGKRAAILAAAEAGQLPEPPDFSAKTHERYRGKLAKLVELVGAGDVKALRAMTIPTYDSSVAALSRYRFLALTALEARTKAGA